MHYLLYQLGEIDYVSGLAFIPLSEMTFWEKNIADLYWRWKGLIDLAAKNVLAYKQV